MGAVELPNIKVKLGILHSKDTKPEELSRWGRVFYQEGWLTDALLFLEKAKDEQGLKDLRARVVEEGDVFLFRLVQKAQNQPAEGPEWQKIGDRALALGKWQFAWEAFRLAGNRKAMDAVHLLMHPANETEEPAASDDQGAPAVPVSGQ